MGKKYTSMVAAGCLWILLGNFNSVAWAEEQNVTIVSSPKAVETLKDFEKAIDVLLGSATKVILPYFVRNLDTKLSSQCVNSLMRVFMDARKLKFSAAKMLDSIAKPSSGLLEGTFSLMGDYEECLGISVNNKGDTAKDAKDESYHGQYCTVTVGLPSVFLRALEDHSKKLKNGTHFGKLANIIQNIPLANWAEQYFHYQIGICAPSTCSVKDMQEAIKLVTIILGMELPMDVKRCESLNSSKWTVDQQAILAVFGLLAIFVILGTTLDCARYLNFWTARENPESKFSGFLLSFSIYGNTQKLLQKPKNSSSAIPCINGMYAWGTVMVIIYHAYFLPFIDIYSRNLANINRYFESFSFVLISTMAISIEAYFLFSGFFLVYSRWKNSVDQVEVNVPIILLRRYIRFCPSLMIILGLIIILPIFGSGPVWYDITNPAAENSRKWWWTFFLLFNNFLSVKNQAFLYLWFIPCLMQVTIVGVMLAWILGRFTKLGISMIIASGIVCNVFLGILTFQRNYPPSYAIYYFNHREMFEFTIYTSPLSHISSYGIGMLLGYYMSRNPILKLKRVFVIFGWIISFLFTVGVQWVVYFLYNSSIGDNQLIIAVYGSVHKTIFCIGLSWIILACTHGYGGFLGKLLCWKGFGPLSKLGYLSYLVHYLVITYHVASARSPLPYVHLEMCIRASGYVILTFLLAYVLYVCFEIPLTHLEYLLFPKKSNENLPHTFISNSTNGINNLNQTTRIPDGKSSRL